MVQELKSEQLNEGQCESEADGSLEQSVCTFFRDLVPRQTVQSYICKNEV